MRNSRLQTLSFWTFLFLGFIVWTFPSESRDTNSSHSNTIFDEENAFHFRYPDNFIATYKTFRAELISKIYRLKSIENDELIVMIIGNIDSKRLADWLEESNHSDFVAGATPLDYNLSNGREILYFFASVQGGSPYIYYAITPLRDKIILFKWITQSKDTFENFTRILSSFAEGPPKANSIEPINQFIKPGDLDSMAPGVNSCCNVTSSGNPYPCCGGGTGNCTWWSWHKRDDIHIYGSWGDAKDWAANAAVDGFPVDKTPRIGDIMCLKDLGDFGHVAYVETIVSGNQVQVSEQNWCLTCTQTKTWTYTNYDYYFIHPKNGQCPPCGC